VVVQAIHKKTQTKVAIKRINNIDRDIIMTRSVLREIIIMRKFSEIKDNIFTTKVYDIIFPENAVTWSSYSEMKTP
jgi:hypothetical protein